MKFLDTFIDFCLTPNMMNYYLLLQYESGISQFETVKVLWFGKFKSKNEAIIGCHFNSLMPEIYPDYIEFEEWLEDTQGEESASEWRNCLASYESIYKKAIEKIENGVDPNTIPISVIEIESPVEENSLKVLFAGAFGHIKSELIKLLLEEDEGEFLVKKFEDEDINHEKVINSLSIEKFENLIEEYVEWKNDL